jgi:hypothetical protein
MADFNIRSDSVNVEQIMEQIRARIREKRGVDYTEQQIRELAAVKLETFLNPHQVTSGLLEQFREGGVSPFENYEFEDSTLFASHRAPLRWIRRLLRPLLKLFFNLDRLIAVLHLQARINTKQAHFGQVSFELMHNLVVETTRLGIEVKNLKMRVESLSSRFDFAERRARALEAIVQARVDERGDEPAGRGRSQQPGRSTQAQTSPQAMPADASGRSGPATPAAAGRDGETSGDARRRRRRRRGRRSGANRPGTEETSPDPTTNGEADDAEPGAGHQASEPGAPGEGPEGRASGSDDLPFPDRKDQ